MTLAEHLARYAPADWVRAIDALAPAIHPIDRDATRIWFAFYPQGPQPAAASSSHNFLYGHHHWPQVKRAILATANDTAWSDSLADLIIRVADHATRTVQADRDQLLGITAASMLTLRSVGHDVFAAASSAVQVPRWSHVRSIRQVRRARSERTFRLRGGFRVRFSELHRRDRCRVSAGDIVATGLPPERRACGAACTGACAFGVIAGAARFEAMSATEQSLLHQTGQRVPAADDGAPLVRLACHAKPTGDVTLVLRPSSLSL